MGDWEEVMGGMLGRRKDINCVFGVTHDGCLCEVDGVWVVRRVVRVGGVECEVRVWRWTRLS